MIDIILLTGVPYHLCYPFWGLRLVRDLLVDRGTLLVETATFGDANALPLLLCPTGADNPCEPISCTFFRIKGFTEVAQSLGFAVVDLRCLFGAI